MNKCHTNFLKCKKKLSFKYGHKILLLMKPYLKKTKNIYLNKLNS